MVQTNKQGFSIYLSCAIPGGKEGNIQCYLFVIQIAVPVKKRKNGWMSMK